MTKEKGRLLISSPVFDNEGPIPSRYTCDGDNIHPPLIVDQIPPDAVSLVIIMEDPDAPDGVFDHWLAWNIPAQPRISENSNPGTNGVNGKGKRGYHGPCPPSGTHRYYIYVFALDAEIEIRSSASKAVLKAAMRPHILAEGIILGMYSKHDEMEVAEHLLEDTHH